MRLTNDFNRDAISDSSVAARCVSAAPAEVLSAAVDTDCMFRVIS